jgi:hypothetical protein
MKLADRIKVKLGACPSCRSFRRETRDEGSFTRPIPALSESEEVTRTSVVCWHCRHVFSTAQRSDVTTERGTEEIHGGAGWGWYDVTIYYKKGVRIGEVRGTWHSGDNR